MSTTITLPKSRRRISYDLKLALLDVIAKKRFSDRPGFAAIAARHGTTAGSLRELYMAWSRNQIDMGDPNSPQEREMDQRQQHEKVLKQIKDYRDVVQADFDALLHRSQIEQREGKQLAWKDNRMPEVLKELKEVIALQHLQEKGFNAMLEDARERIARAERRLEKPVNGSVLPVSVQDNLASVNDEERAMLLLGEYPVGEPPAEAPTDEH